jgi:hypothetical protein
LTLVILKHARFDAAGASRNVGSRLRMREPDLVRTGPDLRCIQPLFTAFQLRQHRFTLPIFVWAQQQTTNRKMDDDLQVQQVLLNELDRVYYDVLLPHEEILVASLVKLQKDEAQLVEAVSHMTTDRVSQHLTARTARAVAAEERLRAALFLDDDDDSTSKNDNKDDADDDDASPSRKKTKKKHKQHDDVPNDDNNLEDAESSSSSDDDDSAFDRLKTALLTMDDHHHDDVNEDNVEEEEDDSSLSVMSEVEI